MEEWYWAWEVSKEPDITFLWFLCPGLAPLSYPSINFIDSYYGCFFLHSLKQMEPFPPRVSKPTRAFYPRVTSATRAIQKKVLELKRNPSLYKLFMFLILIELREWRSVAHLFSQFKFPFKLTHWHERLDAMRQSLVLQRTKVTGKRPFHNGTWHYCLP